RFDLTDAANRPVQTHSGGMRRRLDLAAALVNRPRVLFLDEPTTGLDPRSRLGLWEVLGDLVADGTTLLLTTQYLEEADRLADHIVVIDHARIIAEGSAAELKETQGTTLAVVRFPTVRRARIAARPPAAIGPNELCEAEATDPLGADLRIPVTAVVSDALAVARRNLIGLMRVPTTLVFSTVQPVIFVLMFRYVFGGAIRVPGVSYVDFLMAGIFVQTVTFGAMNTG